MRSDMISILQQSVENVKNSDGLSVELCLDVITAERDSFNSNC